MRGPLSSIARACYRLGTRRRLARNEWSDDYWYERDGTRIVPCRRCPKFDARHSVCCVPFGSPLRKCVVAATEAHLRQARGQRVLELGYARRSYPKHVIETSGGSWTGVEPLVERHATPRIGTGGYGHAGDIPFPNETFDLVFGNQSFEHWEEPLPNGASPPSYRDCLKEVWRVLRPGAALYLDAPIHLHGHEMFVAGDLDRILALFDRALWRDVIAERWRYDHEPLPRYPTPTADIGYTQGTITSYDAAFIADLQANGTVWLLTVTAIKHGSD
jgi:SAM-dependent methyltransferase